MAVTETGWPVKLEILTASSLLSPECSASKLSPLEIQGLAVYWL